MAWEPSLGAFFGPVALVILVTLVYFTCAFVQLRRHPERKYELKSSIEEQQRLSDVPQTDSCAQCVRPAPTLRNEHSFRAQLRSTAFTLVLFVCTWAFGALAVSQGPVLDMIFSCLYGAFSVTLGLFVLIHHCAKRDDVWHCWSSCCPGRRKKHPRCKKINANGDAQCPVIIRPVCSCRNQGHVTCMAPVSPCCAHLQLIDDETHVLRCDQRPAVRLKPRTKTRRERERELAFHIPESRHSSPHAHICHLNHDGHVCHHETLALCQRRDVPEPFMCSCDHAHFDHTHSDQAHFEHAHFELHPRRQSLANQSEPRRHSMANQNGVLKAHEGVVFASDGTGNIRTGPWRNETTV